MAQIDHTFVEQNTNQVVSSASYVDVTGAAITSGNFIAGKKYLLYINAEVNEDSSGLLGIRILHGSTAFAESETLFNDSAARYASTPFMTVWTAVSSEGIKMQAKVSGGNVNIDTISMLAINLSDNLVENTDWKYAERTNDDALSTTPTDGASVTITPPSASDWLVLTTAQMDFTDSTTQLTSSIVRSGEASSSAPTVTFVSSSAAHQRLIPLARVFALTNASNTFKEQSSAAATAHTRLHSAIFILNLNKFAVHSSAYTAADIATPNTYTELQTVSITPTVTGNVWMGGYFGYDRQSGVALFNYRLQLDNVNQPTGVGAATFTSGVDATNLHPAAISTMASLSNVAHTVDLDARIISGSGGQTSQDRTVWAVTMELRPTAVTFTAAIGSYLTSGVAAVLRIGSFTILEHRR